MDILFLWLSMKIKLFSALLLGMCLIHPLHAQVSGTRDSGAFSLYVENDIFAGTDYLYTNGTKIIWISPDLSSPPGSSGLPRWLEKTARTLSPAWNDDAARAFTVALGQKMYTPQDITRTDLIENDRPYAGVSYLEIGFQAKTPRRLDTLIINWGIVGPHSYAEQMQKFIHWATGSTRPLGWEHQLPDEMILGIAYETRRKWWIRNNTAGFSSDIITTGGTAFGNALIDAAARCEARFGWRLPRDFGTSLIRPGGEAIPFPAGSSTSPKRWGVYGFIAFDTRLVIRDIFLDGSTFQSSHSIDRHYFLADITAGFGITRGRIKFSYMYAWLSRRFPAQPRPQVYGSVNLFFSY